MAFRVLPIPTALAEEARRTLRSPGSGLPVPVSVATAQGYGPCRHCLRRTREGERRLLVTYDPYPEPGEVSVVGPIFLHDGPCEAFRGEGFPEELRGLPLVLRGHLREGAGILNRPLGDAEPEAALEALLADPAIAFVALQNAEAGCFVARVERLPA